MEKPTKVNQATKGTFCHCQKQSDVERLVYDTTTRIEGAIGEYNQNNKDSFYVGQTEAQVAFPFFENGVDSSNIENYSFSDDDCAPLFSGHACADKKEYIFSDDTSFEDEEQSQSTLEGEEQPDSSFKEEAQTDTSFEENEQPDSSFGDEKQSQSTFEGEAQHDSPFEDEVRYNSSVEKEVIPLPVEAKAQLVESKTDSVNGVDTAAYSTYSYDSDDAVVVEQKKDEKNGKGFRGQAIPECCLTDSVFMVDRPTCAVMSNQELHRLPMLSMEAANRHGKYRIVVTNVYSPFQFWFRFSVEDCGYNLESLHMQMYDHYNRVIHTDSRYWDPITRFLLRPGNLCAANSYWGSWKRARIVSAPQENATDVSVFYVDYGRLENIACKQLRYLAAKFANIPAMAVRGTLSHVHPLADTWPVDVTEEFRECVTSCESLADIIEMDEREEIYFIKIYQFKWSNVSVNSRMIEAKLAGESEHFDKGIIKQRCGRRIRYLCERLPSFEMLETGVFPMDADKDLKFMEYFKKVLSTTNNFELKFPSSQNPFRQDLEKALLEWIVGFKKEQMPWRKLVREAAVKAKEEDKKRRAYYEKILKQKKG